MMAEGDNSGVTGLHLEAKIMEICGTDQSHGAMIDEDEDSKKGRDNGQEDEKPTDASIDSSLVASDAAAINCSLASSTTKRLRIPAKFRNKKPADMPRRPLSAYNIFFRDQRRQIMEDRHRGVVSQLNAATTSTGSGSGGLFESMARTIASRWKTIAKDELELYTQLANEDTLRYRAQMEEYNQKFVEDKSMAAKKRRAENRKMKQVEKAQTKARESLSANNGLTSQLREEETVHTAVPSTSPRNILQQNVTGKYPHTGSATTAHHSQFSNDNQMRLMLAHANELSQTIPSIQNQNNLVQEYLQIQAAQSPTILTQQQLSPARSRLAATGQQDGSLTSFYQVGTQNQWSILQLLHHQHVQQHSLPTTSTAHFGDLNQFFTMQQPYQQTRQLHVQPQLQLQQQQPQPQQQMPSQLDNTAVGLLLQQFQQQHFRLQQQQNMVHWNTNASFYQQQQQQQQQNQPQVQQEIIHREDSDNLDSSSTGRRQRKNSGSQD